MKNTMIVLLSLLSNLALAGDPPLSHDQIKSTVDGHLADVKGCMKEHGAATGKLVVEFAIQPDGHVTESKPKQRSSNAALDHCIASAFQRWTFPKPRGGVLMGVDYPFAFAEPKKQAPGTLDQKQIVDVVHSKQSGINACYESAAKDKDAIKGTVNVAVVISPAGSVSEASVKDSTTAAPKLDECLVARLKTWQFPKPAGNGEVAVIYPFVFSDKGGPRGR